MQCPLGGGGVVQLKISKRMRGSTYTEIYRKQDFGASKLRLNSGGCPEKQINSSISVVQIATITLSVHVPLASKKKPCSVDRM